MNSERLLAFYEEVAEAPDAIARLRRFVLDLAVRGKLVAQEPSDEPASELLKRIAAEKARLVNAGALRRTRDDAHLSPDDPYELPNKWLWAPFGELHYLVRGVTYSKGDVSETPAKGYAPILRANNIGPTLTHDDPVYVKAERVSPDQYLRRGDYMIALSSGSKSLVGKAAVVSDDLHYAFGGFCGAVRPVDPALVGFFGVFLSSDIYREKISAGSRGIGINNLKKEVLANLHFPLPPLAEQQRIVAKVDELMALLDRLESARTTRESTRDRLTTASLARLTAPDADPAEFPANARFALSTLPALTTRPDQIKGLRQTILNLAVRGRLVEQDPTDEPASELFERIAAEKAQLLKTKQILRQKPPSPDPEYAISTLPSGWKTIALGDMLNFVTSGSRGWSDYYADTGPFFIRAQNIRFGQLLLDNLAHVQPPTNSEGSRTQVAKGDVLIVITGAGVTNPAILERDIGEAYVSQHVGLARPTDSETSRWLLLCLLADCGGRSELVERAYGAGRPGLNLDNIRSLTIPLAPLAEQHRIVAKVDALMALCDRLEAALTTADTTRTRLLEALLHEALEPSTALATEAAE